MSMRIATIKDAKQISDIYKYYVEHTTATFEYIAPTPEDFEGRISSTLEKYPYLVYEVDGKIAGYAYAATHMVRAAYSWNAVMSVYVDGKYHKQGIGTKLYNELICILIKQNIKNVYGCITSGNDISISMHEKMGFVINATFHNSGFKNGKWMDVTWMEKQISAYDIPPKPFTPFPEL